MKFFTLLFLLACTISCAQEKENDISLIPDSKNYTVSTVVPDLDIPWGMTWLPDGSMLITEKDGRIIQFKDGSKILIENVPAVYLRGQGGLLDIALHPNYKNNGWLYLTFASDEGEEDGGHTALVRAKLNGNTLTSIEKLYKATPNTRKGQHFGSRITFDNDGYLYFSVGERGARDINPQDLARDGGKVYRLYDDGRIPEDNPYYNQKGAKKAVYSYGHRNPQGMVKHPETGQIWVHEHGPRGGDEINVIKKAANYGWPVISYGINYSGTKFTEITEKEGMEQPLYYWTPSIAPSGMDFITSNNYPEWKNRLLVGSLKFEYLELLTIENNSVTHREKLLEGLGRVRNVKQGPDGYIYAGIEGKGIVKIIPKKS